MSNILHAKPTLPSGPACAGSIIQCFGAKRARCTRGCIYHIYIYINTFISISMNVFICLDVPMIPKPFKFKDFKKQGPHEYIYLHSWDFINMLFGAALPPLLFGFLSLTLFFNRDHLGTYPSMFEPYVFAISR